MRLIILLAGLTCSLLSCIETQQSKQTLFSLMDPDRTGVRFRNDLPENEQFNIIEYLYFYNGGGVATGDINNDNLPDIYFTSNTGSDKLYLNKGNLRFEEVHLPDAAEVKPKEKITRWKTGVTMADVNGDGWLDIYVCEVGNYKSLKGANRLYINKGQQKKPRFEERAEEYGLAVSAFSTQVAFFDYDRDGDLDMFLLTHSVHSPAVYRDTAQRREPDAMAGDRLFRNELIPAPGKSPGKFTEVTAEAGIYQGKAGYGLGISVADFNNDGWQDVYVGNDFHENDYLYYNAGNGTFREGIENSMGHTSMFSMGNDAADINNDGWQDLISVDMMPEQEPIFKESALNDSYDIYEFKRSKGYQCQYPKNCLQVNQGVLPGEKNARFSEIAQLNGIDATDWSWSPLFADYDNDGWKDLYITNGIVRRPIDLDYLKYQSDKQVQAKATNLEIARQMPSGEAANYAFRNLGECRFEKAAGKWGLQQKGLSNGAAYADLDNDGDLDLVVSNINHPAFIYRNNATKMSTNHFLRIRLRGESANSFGFGARVWVHLAGGRMMYNELQPVKGFQSSVENVLHFGLGEDVQADSVVVIWASGARQVYPNVAADGTLNIEATSGMRRPEPTPAPFGEAFVSGIRGGLRLEYRHREDAFNETSAEKMIPRLLSAEGPALATADINGDGFEDIFTGGGAGQAGQFFIQDKKGNFKSWPNAALQSDKDFEDVDALFFDADGDKDPDLYIVSGGNHYMAPNPLAQDRLYFNNGKGNFSVRAEALPVFYHSGSCVRTYDFDDDDDLDLFVGSRSVPGQYGVAPRSYLLENDGKGRFRDVTETKAPDLAQAGMVTDAQWGDLNNDKQADLVMVGDWMPVTIFSYNGKLFRKTVLTNTEGWWNCISLLDADRDGDTDLIGGNLGLNTRLRAIPSQPMSLYIADLDKNGLNELLFSYFQQGKEYPFATKDEIAAQYPAIRKQYVSYQEYAHSTFGEIFDPTSLKDALRLRTSVLSTQLFLNKLNFEFEKRELPWEAQWAPVRSIFAEDLDDDGNTDLLLAGNDYGMQPAIGRFDAGYGLALKGDGKGGFEVLPPAVSGFYTTGQVRRMKVLHTAFGGRFLLVARNDDRLLVFQIRSIGREK